MRKFLRLTLVCLMAMVCSSALADEKTILTNASSGDWLGDAEGYSATIDGFTISYLKNKSTSDLIAPSSDHIRVYKNAMLVIEGTSNEVITGITLNCLSGKCEDMTVENETVVANGTTITWTGNTKRFEAVATGGQVRIKSIVITYTKESADFVASPTINGETEFEGSTEVTITGGEGTTIYYTLDGTDPTTATPTSGATPLTFTLDKSATVKAIAVKDGNSSDVASKTFTKVTFTDMTVADLHELTKDQAYVNLEIKNGKVVYIDNRYSTPNVFVRDGEKAIMFYSTSLPFKENATVSGTVRVDYANYYGIHEVKSNSFTNAEKLTITESDEEAQPIVVTIADVLDLKYICDYVKIENVAITKSGKSFYAKDENSQVQLYGNDEAVEKYADDGKTYNVTAVFNAIYDGHAEIMPIAVEVSTGIDNVTVEEGLDENAPMYNLAGQRVSKDAKGIVIQNGKKYIRR